MISGGVGTAGVLAAALGTRVMPELALGLAGPLVSAVVSWQILERTHRSAPERLTNVMILSRLLGAVIALHRMTLRVERLHFEHYLGLKARRVPILFALWHGRMFLSIQAHRGEGIATMASQWVLRIVRQR